jgi:hypothetical protein
MTAIWSDFVFMTLELLDERKEIIPTTTIEPETMKRRRGDDSTRMRT